MILYSISALCGILVVLLTVTYFKNRELKNDLIAEVKNSEYIKTRNQQLIVRINALKRECELKNDLAKRNQERLLKIRDGYVCVRSQNEFMRLASENPVEFDRTWNSVPFNERVAFRSFAVKELEEKYGILVG